MPLMGARACKITGYSDLQAAAPISPQAQTTRMNHNFLVRFGCWWWRHVIPNHHALYIATFSITHAHTCICTTALTNSLPASAYQILNKNVLILSNAMLPLFIERKTWSRTLWPPFLGRRRLGPALVQWVACRRGISSSSRRGISSSSYWASSNEHSTWKGAWVLCFLWIRLSV